MWLRTLLMIFHNICSKNIVYATKKQCYRVILPTFQLVDSSRLESNSKVFEYESSPRTQVHSLDSSSDSKKGRYLRK